MRFSQRKGISPVKSKIQIDSVDNDLRIGLWNVLSGYVWRKVKSDFISPHKDMERLFRRMWIHYFNKPLDTLNDHFSSTYKEIREYFFNCDWFEVYDFIEFVARNYPEERDEARDLFMETCKEMLKRELSAYRFLGGKITQLTAEEEILEVEKALEVPISPVKEHLNRALELLADRKNPDYRNSIKEAISAVESICIIITDNETTTLGRALNKIETDGNLDLHTDLKDGFKKLYSYTSEADGIRHSLMNQPHLDFEDAKFMLVSCSAFINYLVSKASKADIILST
jgi:hypothetical protein